MRFRRLVPSIFSITAIFVAAPSGAGERPEPPAPTGGAPLVRLAEGALVLYKGTIKVSRRQMGDEAEEYSASLEVGYLGLGDAPAGRTGAGRRVLLLRSGESAEKEDPTFCEAVSLFAAPDLELSPEIPTEDRAQRVSPFSFSHLPLGIFPPLAGAEPREWKAPARLQILFSQLSELSLRHRVEAGPRAGTVRYLLQAESGQRAVFRKEHIEVPFEVTALDQTYVLSLADGRLLSFESRVGVRFPAGAGPTEAEERRVEIELVLSEASRFEGARLARIQAEADEVREIERSLFVDFSPEVAESRAAAFEKERPGSRLAVYALGLGHQAPAVWPIAGERRLYGKPAPDFTLPDLDGKSVTLSAILPGKVTLLVFFSAGCLACRAEAPCLTRFDQKYRDRGFQVLAVDAENKDSREQAAEFARQLKLTHRILVGGGQAAERFEFQDYLPTSFWIDRDGKILRRDTGFRPEMERDIERTIELLLPREAPAARDMPPPAENPPKKEKS